jgi:hypothetical protein
MLRYLPTSALLLLVALATQAQPSSGGPTPVDGVPIDGGISLLAASGVAYSITRLRQRRRR